MLPTPHAKSFQAVVSFFTELGVSAGRSAFGSPSGRMVNPSAFPSNMEGMLVGEAYSVQHSHDQGRYVAC